MDAGEDKAPGGPTVGSFLQLFDAAGEALVDWAENRRMCGETYRPHDERWCGLCVDRRDGVELAAAALGTAVVEWDEIRGQFTVRIEEG